MNPAEAARVETFKNLSAAVAGLVKRAGFRSHTLTVLTDNGQAHTAVDMQDDVDALIMIENGRKTTLDLIDQRKST
ncbi:hypothetical protein ACAW74_18270 [Fibrella sp. WM1]|uniref:hypothetical protein n=1 Tax=Fibrella musci TaxID=3242485 RepID=UPI003522F1BC